MTEKREAKQKRAALIRNASKAAKNGFLEKDQQKKKVPLYSRKSINQEIQRQIP